MRSRMANVERQCRLIEFAALDRDAGGLAAERMPPVGAGHQPCGEGLSVSRMNGYVGVARTNRVSLVVKSSQRRKLGRAFLQRLHQQAIFDVVAKFVETNFPSRKPHLGCTDQPAGIVDKAHRLQCGRIVLAARPDIQRLQEIDRAAQQRRCAVIGIGRAAGDQGGLGTSLRQCNRGAKSGGAATDHGDVKGG